MLHYILPRSHKLFLFKWIIGVVILMTACVGISTPVGEDSRSKDISPTNIPSRIEISPIPKDAPIQLPKKLKFENISVDQGLSQSSVLSILQDSKGFMWFGTEDGLNKYDGYNFTIFKHDPDDPNSLSNNFILDLYEDREGMLWAGTMQGLDRYDRESDRWIHYPLDQVRTILEDNTDKLWVGSQAGLYFFDRELDGLKRQNSNRIYSLYQDSNGVIWIGTDQGIYNISQMGEKIDQYLHIETDPSSLADNLVREIFEDQLGSLWVGTSGGLDRFDRATKFFTHFQFNENDPYSIRHDDIWAIYEDYSGVLWVGTDGGGLERYDPVYERFFHYQNIPDDINSLSSNQIRVVTQDRGGVLWIGTNAGGIDKVDVAQKGFTHYRKEVGKYNSLSNDNVLSFFEDYSRILWIGTGGGGINRFDRQVDLFTNYHHDPEDPDSLSDDFISSVYVDRDGVLWAGGAREGLNSFDRFTGGFTHFTNDPSDPDSLAHNSVSSILEDRHGTLWIGMQGGGLDAFDRLDKRFIHFSGLSSEFVNMLYEDRQGELWIGTDGGGISKLDRQDGTFTHYTHDPYDPQSLSSDDILTIYQDQEGEFWIGTNGGGLNKFDPQTDTFTHYRERDGLPNDVVYGILEDDEGMLWLSTNNGLSKFNPQTSVFRNYDVRDGLQSNEFNANAYFKNQRGEMFFGGVNGFNEFKPDQIQDNLYQPPIVLTSLTQAGGNVDLGAAVESTNEVSFYWPNNFFEFEFAALSYSHPEKNQYAFMLEGFRDEDWNYIGNNRVGRYTNLPGGTYTLRLKGSNKDGTWNETGTAVRITVVPPIWGTWWFQGIGVLILVVGVIAGFRLRVRNIQSRTRELESQVLDRTRELEALNAIATVVSSSLNLERILKDALDKTLEVVQVEAGGIYLIIEGSDVLTINARKGLSDRFVAEVDNLMVGEGFSGQVIQSGETLVVADVSSDPRLTRTVVSEEGYHALVVLPLASRGIVLGTMFLISRDFRDFSEKEIEMLNAIGGQIGGAVENARFFEAEHRRSEQFKVLAEVGSRVGRTLNVNEVLEEVVRLIQGTFDYYHVALGLVEGDDLVYRVGSGELWDNPKFRFKPARLKIGREGLSGWVAATGQPLVIPDVSKEPRYVWMHGSQTHSEITVPVIVKGQVIGVLDVQSDQVNAFDETDLAVLQSLAHQVGAAIENARLYEQAQQAAVLEERARLARDLHDAVTQTLFSASLLAEALPASWEKDREEGQLLLEELKQLNRGALAEMRTLLIELRPAALLEAKLGDLLRQLAEAASGREGLSIDVKVDCECSLPADVHIALYRIAQESLNNILKHARASEVQVTMNCSVCESDGHEEEQPRKITLLVKDNGRGFDQNLKRPDHLGLEIMRERAKDIGAQIIIESQSEVGTSIRVIWEDQGTPE